MEQSFQTPMEGCSQRISDLCCRRQSCRWVPFCGSSLQPWECVLEGVILLRSLRSMSIVFCLIIRCLLAAWIQLGEYGVFWLWKDIGGIMIRLNSWCRKCPTSFFLSDQIDIAGQCLSDPLKERWGELMRERKPFTWWPTEVMYTGFPVRAPHRALTVLYILVFIEPFCWYLLLWNMSC